MPEDIKEITINSKPLDDETLSSSESEDEVSIEDDTGSDTGSDAGSSSSDDNDKNKPDNPSENSNSKPKGGADDDDAESSSSSSSGDMDGGTEVDTEQFLTADPLYFVLSKVFVAEDGRNIATILSEICAKLEKR